MSRAEEQNIERMKMSLSGWECFIPLREVPREPNNIHATNPFASGIEDWHRLGTQVEVAPPDAIADMFSDDGMSDNVSKAEQNLRIAQSSHTNSSQASPDSAELANETTINSNNVWPPLNTSVIATGDWPNSNRELAVSSDTSKWVENMNVGKTLGGITPHLAMRVDPLGPESHYSKLAKPWMIVQLPPSGSKLGKRKSRKGMTPKDYAFTTSPILGPSTLRLERTATSQHSDAGSVASPDSTVTRGIKETENIRKDFGYGMEQLKQVQTKLTKKNTNHVQTAEVLVMEMEESRKEVNEIKMEGRANQGKIETTMATVKDLNERRISGMTAIMAQRDKRADERLKCMSEMMHRRDLDVDKRMVDLMTTVQDLTLGVKTVAARVLNSPSPVLQALDPAKEPSTCVSNIAVNLSRSCPKPNWY